MTEAQVHHAPAAEQPPSAAGTGSSAGAGLHAQALEGDCALCGSGIETEPLGWVVSTLVFTHVFHPNIPCIWISMCHVS